MIWTLAVLMAVAAYILRGAHRVRMRRARREEFRYLLGCKPWWGQR